MHVATTALARKTTPEASATRPENRAWGFFGDGAKRTWKIDPQVVETHSARTTTKTTTAPGVPYWPSRDSIGEEGGLNLYDFVGNDGVNGIDLLGLVEPIVSAPILDLINRSITTPGVFDQLLLLDPKGKYTPFFGLYPGERGADVRGVQCPTPGPPVGGAHRERELGFLPGR
jgi:hypothetical protein